MKRGIIILAFAMSCNPKQATEQNSVEVKEGNVLENFSMTTDTLMIDMEGEFINFGIPLITSVSVDGDYFFNLNYQTLHLQKISLDEMRLTDTLTFKKEGPDSPGFTFTIQPLPENQFFFPSMERPNVINSEAKICSSACCRTMVRTGCSRGTPTNEIVSQWLYELVDITD
jgi:hypothetical protein